MLGSVPSCLTPQYTEVHVGRDVRTAGQQEGADLLVSTEGPQSVPVLPFVPVVSDQGQPAVLHDPVLDEPERVPGGRGYLDSVPALQTVLHCRLLQQHAGGGGVA